MVDGTGFREIAWLQSGESDDCERDPNRADRETLDQAVDRQRRHANIQIDRHQPQTGSHLQSKAHSHAFARIALTEKHGREKFEDVSNYVPLSNYLIDKFKQETNLDSREGMGQLVDGIVPLVSKLPACALRELLTKDIAKLADMDIDSLKNLIDQKQTPIKKTQAQHLVSTSQYKKESKNHVADAIRWLLHNPELGMTIEPNTLSDIETKGVEFLRELLSLIHQQPEISCAGILEHWRDSKYEERLNKLSIEDCLLTEPDAIKSEFLEIIEKIKHDHQKQLRNINLQKLDIKNPEEARSIIGLTPASSPEE